MQGGRGRKLLRKRLPRLPNVAAERLAAEQAETTCGGTTC